MHPAPKNLKKIPGRFRFPGIFNMSKGTAEVAPPSANNQYPVSATTYRHGEVHSGQLPEEILACASLRLLPDSKLRDDLDERLYENACQRSARERVSRPLENSTVAQLQRVPWEEVPIRVRVQFSLSGKNRVRLTLRRPSATKWAVIRREWSLVPDKRLSKILFVRLKVFPPAVRPDTAGSCRTRGWQPWCAPGPAGPWGRLG